MRIPKKIKIGPYTYDVVYKDNLTHENNKLWGLCDRESHNIYLQKKMDAQKKKEVLLHECLHAIEESYGITLGENKVNQLGLALLALIYDNKLKF